MLGIYRITSVALVKKLGQAKSAMAGRDAAH